jgi:Tol biopolymer transport system component
MKFYSKLIMLFLITAAIIHSSCQKELSCENCENNPPGDGGTLNKPPVANAGIDKLITLPTDSVLLDGSASGDPDGSISEWVWRKISGPVPVTINSATTATTIVKYLSAAVYEFELQVKDNKGLIAKDTVQVIVKDPNINQPPVAKAGLDQTITLPVNTVNLDGRGSIDPDNNIAGYVWTKISGPSSFNIANANLVQTLVTSLVQGIYQFELTVTDAGSLSSKDTVKVTVKNPTTCTGCKIVFVSNRDGNNEIYSCNVDGSNIQRLTNDAGRDDHPAWSPDGTKIAFISDRTGNTELYSMNIDGSNPVRMTNSGSYTDHPTWSPDGTRILYSTLTNGSMNLWVIGVAGGSPSLLFAAPGWDDQPTWSPDGTKIALASDWMAYDMVIDIYTINADGTGFTALTGNIFDHFDYLYPSWSPNGTKLAMAIQQTIGIDQYITTVGVMNIDGSEVTVIRQGAAPYSRTSWSDDGTKISYTSLFGSRMDVSWVSADGTSWGTIVTNGWNADWQH